MKQALLVITLLLTAQNSHATTASEFSQKFTNGEQVAYVLASAEMAISIYKRTEHLQTADCIRTWLVDTPEEMMHAIDAYLTNPDNAKYSAAGIIRLLFDQYCASDNAPVEE